MVATNGWSRRFPLCMAGGTFGRLDQIAHGTNKCSLGLPVASQAIGHVNWNADANGTPSIPLRRKSGAWPFLGSQCGGNLFPNDFSEISTLVGLLTKEMAGVPTSIILSAISASLSMALASTAATTICTFKGTRCKHSSCKSKLSIIFVFSASLNCIFCSNWVSLWSPTSSAVSCQKILMHQISFSCDQLLIQLLTWLFIGRVKQKVLDFHGILRGWNKDYLFYIVRELVRPHLENCTSAWRNQIQALASQNGGKRVATVETIVGSSKAISVTVPVVSRCKKILGQISSRSPIIAFNKNY